MERNSNSNLEDMRQSSLIQQNEDKGNQSYRETISTDKLIESLVKQEKRQKSSNETDYS